MEDPPALTELAHDLNREGVAWCLLRDLPERASGALEVDVLVAPEDLEAFERIARERGFLPIRTWGRGSHAFFLGRDDASDTWLKLDAVTELTYGPLQTLRAVDASRVLASRERTGALPRLAEDDGFWTLLLHCLLDKGRIDEKHRPALQHLAGAAKETSALGAMTGQACPPGWDAPAMVRAAESGQWDALEKLAPELAARWPSGRRRSVTATRNRLLRSTTRLLLVPRRGFSAAIIAPDGAGKSTLCANLRGTLFLPARVIYMGAYRAYADSAPTEQRGFFGRLLRQLRRYLVGRFHRARGRIVIFDRYTFDALLPSLRPRSSRRRVKRWLLGHSLPAPDLTVVLDVPAEEMFARKGEHSLEFLEQRRRDYLALSSVIPRAVVVDGSQEQDSLRRHVASLIWSSYLQKHSAGD
jgi:thymidylate kinase